MIAPLPVLASWLSFRACRSAVTALDLSHLTALSGSTVWRWAGSSTVLRPPSFPCAIRTGGETRGDPTPVVDTFGRRRDVERGGPGVFCQSAIENAQKDHAAVVQNILDNKDRKNGQTAKRGAAEVWVERKTLGASVVPMHHTTKGTCATYHSTNFHDIPRNCSILRWLGRSSGGLFLPIGRKVSFSSTPGKMDFKEGVSEPQVSGLVHIPSTP